jgi:hypothetical protein
MPQVVLFVWKGFSRLNHTEEGFLRVCLMKLRAQLCLTDEIDLRKSFASTDAFGSSNGCTAGLAQKT